MALFCPKVDKDGDGVGEAVLLKVLHDPHHDRVKVVLLNEVGAVWADHCLVGEFFCLVIWVVAMLGVPFLPLLILLYIVDILSQKL